MNINNKVALLVIDLQNDFIPGGTLAVKDGDQIIGPVDKLVRSGAFSKVVATKDYHPKRHVSFASTHGEPLFSTIKLPNGQNQVMWPDHCIQKTKGAEFCSGWADSLVDEVVFKGKDVDVDSYSGFFDNNKIHSTGLDSFLKENEITEVVIVGLATDYCVHWTVIDAIDLGYKVTVIEEATRGVDALESWNSSLAYRAMRLRGVRIEKTVSDYLFMSSKNNGVEK